MAGTEFERLPLLTQTAYARLLDLLLTTEAGGLAAGSLVSKTIRGRRYWYAQRQDDGKPPWPGLVGLQSSALPRRKCLSGSRRYSESAGSWSGRMLLQ